MDPQRAQDDIISTLPRVKGWLSDDNHRLYCYQGFWYPDFFIRGAIAARTQTLSIDLSPSDTILASVPKRGTTWLKALAFAITTRGRFSHSDPNNPLYLKSPHELIPLMENDGGASERHDINLVFTHLPYTALPNSIAARGCKMVYIWRDPKDVFISFWHMCKKIRPNKEVDPIPLHDAFEMFCNGESGFGPYWDHVLGYWKALKVCPERILFLKYEDMMDDTEVHVKRLAEFMGCPLSAEEEKGGVVASIVEMCSFERLRNLEVNKGGVHRTIAGVSFSRDIYFRKAQVGDWNNYLTHEMAAKIDQITTDKLGPLLNFSLPTYSEC